LSSDTLVKATDAYNEALTIKQQVLSLEVPTANSALMETQADQIMTDAERIQKDAELLMSQYQGLLQETMGKRAQLQDLLNRANIQQQEVDGRLADMDKHRAKALEAVEIGNNVLKDAQETLETLKDFENRVNSNKDAAEQALNDVQAIEATIASAKDKTEQADKQLSDAENNSKTAYEVATTSQGIAEKASEKARAIVAESSETSAAATKLKSDAENLRDKLEETTAAVQQKNVTANQDAKLAKEALREANQAQTQARDASTKVAQAKRELEEIAAILQTVEEPEPGLLSDLERRVTAAEAKFLEANLELKLDQLEKAKQKQRNLLVEYMEEMNFLSVEFRSIEEIRNSLPNQCWNKIRLEP